MLAVSGISGCSVQSASSYNVPGRVTNLASQCQTADLENRDRVARFRRLATLQGLAPPQIDELELPAGTVNSIPCPVPVVRVVFDERVFFDFASDQPRPDAQRILDVIAENMRRDVPDAALTLLGHTDAIGSDEYNMDLSQRRAINVLNALVVDGVETNQLSTVAIGKRQPIAPNSTEEGRARNRRVEFMISPSMSANLAAVQQRVVFASYFRLGPARSAGSRLPSSDIVRVLTMRPGLPPGRSVDPQIVFAPRPDLRLRPLTPDDAVIHPDDEFGLANPLPMRPALIRPSAAPVIRQVPEPVIPVQLIKPDPVERRALGQDENHF
jgi:outer membrane protein OmpA-like peptidoglycan-associated protein